MSDWESRLEIYDRLISKCPGFERLGKTMPYTGANGYMFSLLNKAGEIGIRFSEKQKADYIRKFETTDYKSYGATMKGYILIPANMIVDEEERVIELLNESYNYVMGLPPK